MKQRHTLITIEGALGYSGEPIVTVKVAVEFASVSAALFFAEQRLADGEATAREKDERRARAGHS